MKSDNLLAVSADPSREAIGFALAWLDEDDALSDTYLTRYRLSGDAMALVIALVALVAFDRDDEFVERLYELALAKAAT